MMIELKSIFESAKEKAEFLAEENPGNRRIKDEKSRNCAFDIDTGRSFQKIQGFGCALTESSGFVLGSLPANTREGLFEKCFGQDSQKSNCYTFARSHINSCDFSLGNWACVQEKDESLESFSFERTDKYLTEQFHLAQKQNPNLKVIFTPWTPPAWMKTNADMNHGGKLKDEYRDLWASYFVKFILGMKERGVRTDFVSIQNESEARQNWDSCLWTGTEEAEFAVQNLFPALKKSGLDDVKILVWDHNRDRIYERAKESFSVRGADEAIYGMACHWYSGDQYENIAKCKSDFPDKEIFFTEGCIEGGARPGAWFVGERYAHNIINDLKAGCSAWIDWNMALDMDGGPNHAGNLCDAPILVDTKSGRVLLQNSFYYIGHFSRFIKSGARRVFCAQRNGLFACSRDGRSDGAIDSAAFQNPDGSIVFVILNLAEEAVRFDLRLKAGVNDKDGAIVYNESFSCPARGIQTYIFK